MPSIEQARGWYADADAVHDFDHVLRVLRTAERLADIEGADVEITKAAVLLHDVQGATPAGENRQNHHHFSAEFASRILKEEGWTEKRISAVQHCILAHRFRDHSEPPSTLEAKILFDADKLDVLGAIGIARVIAYAALAGTPFYHQPSKQFLMIGKEEPDEPHSAYHEHLFKLRKVPERLFTSAAKEIAEERLRILDNFFEQLILEWEGKK